MKRVTIPGTGLSVSPVIFGCMRLPREYADARKPIRAAAEAGLNFFDHADIYGRGECERVFAGAWDDVLRRDEVVLQTKCGIRPGYYDFGYDHLMAAVDGSLERLATDYVDLLLLHRPDVLMDPDEVARAFDRLAAEGKVRHFGVSNFTPAQVDLLQRSVNQRLVANQVRMSLAFTAPFDSYIVAGGPEGAAAVTRGEGLIEHAMLRNVSIQAYSPLAAGALTGKPLDDQPEYVRETARLVAELAEARGVAPEAILCAWLLRHPAGIQPIVGTMNPARIAACAAVEADLLSREDWYRLFTAARGRKMP